MNTPLLSEIASKRVRDSKGHFVVGLVYTEEEREKARETAVLTATTWRLNNLDKGRAATARAHSKNPEYRKNWFAQRPGYKEAMRLNLRERQAGRPRPEVCEIPGCGKKGTLHFDHCHTAQRFRGWICQGCNKALGYARDNPELLRSLAVYLEQFAQRAPEENTERLGSWLLRRHREPTT